MGAAALHTIYMNQLMDLCLNAAQKCHWNKNDFFFFFFFYECYKIVIEKEEGGNKKKRAPPGEGQMLFQFPLQTVTQSNLLDEIKNGNRGAQLQRADVQEHLQKHWKLLIVL